MPSILSIFGADQLNARNYDRYSTLFCYDGDYLSFREE